MAVYLISFRINEKMDHQNKRYEALTSLIEDELIGDWWGETTSFYIKESILDIDSLASKLINKINERVDKLLLLDINTKNGRTSGDFFDQVTLETLIDKNPDE
ncbi:MAG TPA: hypothetical protein VHL08_06250 [Dongiaceae bacterium]|jgi:hypothetical protein|nr:hypothetical protein [Dongiaceae bacterium]